MLTLVFILEIAAAVLTAFSYLVCFHDPLEDLNRDLNRINHAPYLR